MKKTEHSNEKYIIERVSSSHVKERQLAYRELFALLKPLAMSTMCRFFPAEEHDDIFQNAFIKLIQRLDQNQFQLRDGVPVFAFFRPILLRTGYRHMKLPSGVSSFEYPEDFSDLDVSEMDYISAADEEEDIQVMLNDCLGKLTSENRSIINAFYEDDLSIRDIHNRMGISEGAVRQRLYLIRHQLFKCLKGKMK